MIVTIISVAVILSALGAIWYSTRGTYLVRVKKNQIMDFKSAVELTELPIVTFYQGENKYHFLLDTGSNVSYVNSTSDINTECIEGTDSFLSADGVISQCSLANIKLYYNKKEYKCTVRCSDLETAFKELYNHSGIKLTGILGNDFFSSYKCCLDFKEMVAYSRT
jgi:hypothetical protein